VKFLIILRLFYFPPFVQCRPYICMNVSAMASVVLGAVSYLADATGLRLDLAAVHEKDERCDKLKHA